MNEQPYPLPVGWQWVTLDSVAEIIMGQSPSGDDTTEDSSYTPLIGGAADMGNLFPSITRYTKKPTKLSEKDDVIICVRATLGKPIFSDGEYCLGRGVAALRPRLVSKNFLRYALINFEQYFYDNANGTTFLQIASKPLRRMPFPLPPLDEQQRLVEILDDLFSRLDKAEWLLGKEQQPKELSKSVLRKIELMKKSILARAFRGKFKMN
ncbi:MAG: restriction endonuclease subunit S [Selenomonadaceae bacterium]|nr:restriction endonuclease subunit S [Selenomonadaceae bacterium]